MLKKQSMADNPVIPVRYASNYDDGADW